MKTRLTMKHLLGIIALIALAIWPLIAPHPYIVFILTLVFVYSVITKYYNLLMGYGGIFFLTPMIFMGISGYITAYLTVKSSVNPAIAIAAGVAGATIWSFTFSALSMRLRGLYMALYSMIFLLLLFNLFQNDAPFIRAYTGGSIGIFGLPELVLGGIEFHKFMAIPYYYLTFVIFVVAVLVFYRLVNSSFGLRLQSLRDGETYASTLGVNAFRMKIYSFAISASFMGLAGSVLSLYWFSINPPIFSLDWVLLFFAMVVLGGLGTMWGPFVGTLILIPANNLLTIIGPYRLLFLGAIVLVTVLVMPNGIVGKIEEKLASRRATPGTTGIFPRMVFRKALSTATADTAEQK
ncbi:MAG: branched-chain amino acid ABC transporter permease [Candidatus Bathyarchaeia archaeon]